jgi:Restriction endonuclease AspBHI N-terminal/Restriction endonuclease
MLKIGQIFRVPYRGLRTDTSDLVSYQTLTRGVHDKSADLQKGMFFYQKVKEPNQQFWRVPAFIFHSNPFKKGTEGTPWVDVVEPDAGYCLFHGDNRQVGVAPLNSRGNARFIQVQNQYADPALRKFAPPVLVFEQIQYRGNRRGYRQFCGFGVPFRYSLATQKQQDGGYFTNLVIELVLFRLDRENELFDWNWIDIRRRGSTDADNALKASPSSWKEWVKGGELAIEGCRRIVARRTTVDLAAQRITTNEERRILTAVLNYYAKKKHAFEGLASYVAQRILGPQCKRGWVTQRSGDGGVDFVCRLDVGDRVDRLSRTSAVVLGQAKCVGFGTAIGGYALARVVARLQRGWIGAFVTTGTFSRAAQLELAHDKYPIVLINGQRLARTLFEILTRERIDLMTLLDRETEWYLQNSTHLPPARILEDAFWFESPTLPSDTMKNV